MLTAASWQLAVLTFKLPGPPRLRLCSWDPPAPYLCNFFLIIKAQRNTISLCWMCFAGSDCSSPRLTLFTWRFPRSPGRREKGRLRPTMPRDLTTDTEPPYMVLQPLYATYTDPCRGLTQIPSGVYGLYTCKQAQVYTHQHTWSRFDHKLCVLPSKSCTLSCNQRWKSNTTVYKFKSAFRILLKSRFK